MERWPVPNDCGVFPDELAGPPLSFFVSGEFGARAIFHSLEISEGAWVSSYDHMFCDGGGGCGLWAKGRAHASKKDALDYEVQRTIEQVEKALRNKHSLSEAKADEGRKLLVMLQQHLNQGNLF